MIPFSNSCIVHYTVYLIFVACMPDESDALIVPALLSYSKTGHRYSHSIKKANGMNTNRIPWAGDQLIALQRVGRSP